MFLSQLTKPHIRCMGSAQEHVFTGLLGLSFMQGIRVLLVSTEARGEHAVNLGSVNIGAMLTHDGVEASPIARMASDMCMRLGMDDIATSLDAAIAACSGAPYTADISGSHVLVHLRETGEVSPSEVMRRVTERAQSSPVVDILVQSAGGSWVPPGTIRDGQRYVAMVPIRLTGTWIDQMDVMGLKPDLPWDRVVAWYEVAAADDPTVEVPWHEKRVPLYDLWRIAVDINSIDTRRLVIPRPSEPSLSDLAQHVSSKEAHRLLNALGADGHARTVMPAPWTTPAQIIQATPETSTLAAMIIGMTVDRRFHQDGYRLLAITPDALRMPGIARAAEVIARTGRKFGVSLLVVDPTPLGQAAEVVDGLADGDPLQLSVTITDGTPDQCLSLPLCTAEAYAVGSTLLTGVVPTARA